jgi:hypothetical protein
MRQVLVYCNADITITLHKVGQHLMTYQWAVLKAILEI